MAKTETLPTKNQLANLWHKEYSKRGFCVICGNDGIIDTRGKISNPSGFEYGAKVFCVCPNGRAIKRGYEKNGVELT